MAYSRTRQSFQAVFSSRLTSVKYSQVRRMLSTTVEFDGMDTVGLSEPQITVREAIQKICSKYPDEYWQQHDDSGVYPTELHQDLARDGWLGICMPGKYGGAGLGIQEATIMLQTISESGAGIAGAQTCHANIYATQPIVKFANEAQKKDILPGIMSGEYRTCFGVTEPNTGLETLKLKTHATRKDDEYEITGQKIWITSASVANRMVLLARTTALENVKKPNEGLSMFCIPFDPTKTGLDIRSIKKMGGRAVDANEVFFDGYKVPASSLIGAEGNGFKQILHGMNAERCLLAGEALGLGYAALARAAKYAKERIVFSRPIGQNQAIQHSLADAWCKLSAAKYALYQAARMYDEGGDPKQVGVACNAAKYLAAEAGFEACERAVLAHGGMGYAREFHVERYLREIFVPRIAPVSREMILNYVGERVLGLPRSY